MNCNLILHCGANRVDRSEVRDVPVPASTRSWHPIPHHSLLHIVEGVLERHGLSIVSEAHSLTRDGLRYFGLVQVRHGMPDNDYCRVLGLRNTHDKTFPAGLVAGAQVFVCDNLSFNGEVTLARKHTRFILRDLPGLVEASIVKLIGRWHILENRFAVYREHRIDDSAAHDLLVRAVDCGACTITQVPGVLDHWREPRHVEFRPRNVWSLFNSFTEALKGNLPLLSQRTQRLHHLFDGYIGLSQGEPGREAETLLAV